MWLPLPRPLEPPQAAGRSVASRREAEIRFGGTRGARRTQGDAVNWNAFITCAITGAGETVGRSPHVPVTPADIAQSAIDAAEAGAAVVHIHVRDPATGKGARDPHLYKEVVDAIRSSGVDVVINLTAGMGGDLVLGGDEAP